MAKKQRGGSREGAGRPPKEGVRLSGKISLEADAQLSALEKRGADLRDSTFTRVAAIEWAIGELYQREFGESPPKEKDESQ